MNERVHDLVTFLIDHEKLLNKSNLKKFLPITDTGAPIYSKEEAKALIVGMRVWIENIRRHQSQMGKDQRQALDDYLKNRDYMNNSTLFNELIRETVSNYTPDPNSTNLSRAKVTLIVTLVSLFFGGTLLSISITRATNDWTLLFFTSAFLAALIVSTASTGYLYNKYHGEPKQYAENLAAIKSIVEQIESDLNPSPDSVDRPESGEVEELSPVARAGTLTPPAFFSMHVQDEVARTVVFDAEEEDGDDSLHNSDAPPLSVVM